MSKIDNLYISKHSAEREGLLASYTIGFLLSVVLTFWAYILVVNNELNRNLIITLIAVFAILQFIIQIFYFLHLGKEAKPKWKLMMFLFMLMVVLILVLGSIWIMNNLNYRMTPDQMNDYMRSQSGM